MNWKRIRQTWEDGDKQIAIRLFESMIYEMRLGQRSLLDFQGEKVISERMWNGPHMVHELQCRS